MLMEVLLGTTVGVATTAVVEVGVVLVLLIPRSDEVVAVVDEASDEVV